MPHLQFSKGRQSVKYFAKSETYGLTADGIRSVDYRQTDHYQMTRRFLENPEKC